MKRQQVEATKSSKHKEKLYPLAGSISLPTGLGGHHPLDTMSAEDRYFSDNAPSGASYYIRNEKTARYYATQTQFTLLPGREGYYSPRGAIQIRDKDLKNYHIDMSEINSVRQKEDKIVNDLAEFLKTNPDPKEESEHLGKLSERERYVLWKVRFSK